MIVRIISAEELAKFLMSQGIGRVGIIESPEGGSFRTFFGSYLSIVGADEAMILEAVKAFNEKIRSEGLLINNDQSTLRRLRELADECGLPQSFIDQLEEELQPPTLFDRRN